MKPALLLFLTILLIYPALAPAEDPSPRGLVAATWQEVYARMHPWTGTHLVGSDPSGLQGKILCGYQGWFSAPGDGSHAASAHQYPSGGWVHYGDGTFEPGHCNIDLWPDMSQAGAAERYTTDFRFADGSGAPVFSSYNAKTVNRHFAWMAQYGIDGVFLQRFGSDLRNPGTCDFCDAVLDNVRNAANAHGRTWAVMYDLSGLSSDEISGVITRDWKNLVDRMRVRGDPAYLKDRGKPLVAIWGVGFNDARKYGLKDCAALVDFLKNDPRYGGNSIMLGVPYGWREGVRDATADPELLALVRKADVVSPWSVTRYNSSAGFIKDSQIYQKPDLVWCEAHHLDYLPVIFPGFSWSNLQKTRGKDRRNDKIDRDRGAFLWTQGAGVAQMGVPAIYVAMFDELDEGTAILKCTNQPPAGPSTFESEPGLASDTYLWLTGQIGRMLRQELPFSPTPPMRQ